MTLQKNIIRCIFYYSLLSSTIYSNNTQASDISGNEIFNDIKCGTSELYRDFPMFTTKDWSNTRNAMLKRYSSNIDKYANAPYMQAIQQLKDAADIEVNIFIDEREKLDKKAEKIITENSTDTNFINTVKSAYRKKYLQCRRELRLIQIKLLAEIIALKILKCRPNEKVDPNIDCQQHTLSEFLSGRQLGGNMSSRADRKDPDMDFTEKSFIQKESKSPLPIRVEPYYDYEQSSIEVGSRGNANATTNQSDVIQLSNDLKKSISGLRAEQMYVLAIRLFDAGFNQDAIYWFYQARYRERQFNATLYDASDSNAIKLQNAYRSFAKQLSPYIVGVASCNQENWAEIIKTVLNENSIFPDLPSIYPEITFYDNARWESINDVVSGNMNLTLSLVEGKNSGLEKQCRYK